MAEHVKTSAAGWQRSPGPAPRQDAWEVIGPGGGGGQFLPTISPHDANVVVERCDMTGAYITLDAGLSWRMFNLRTVVQSFAFDPRDPDVIYAGNAALWRSEDRGKTWRMVFPDPARSTVEHMCGDHADYRLTSDDPSYPGSATSIAAIAIDPVDSQRIALGLGGGQARVLVSPDRGRSWSWATGLDPGTVHALHVARASAAEPPRVYVVQSSAVYIGANGEWERLGLADGIGKAAIGEQDGKVVIYTIGPASRDGAGGLHGGVSVSEDGGRTWRNAMEGIAAFVGPEASELPHFTAVSCSSRHAGTCYVGFRGLSCGRGEENTYNGILKTTDAGRTWTIPHRESNRPSDNLEPSWVEPRAIDGQPNIWFDSPIDVGAAPSDPNVCYATDCFRTYRTYDGGKAWQQVISVRVGEEAWTTRGLDVTTCYGVHFDPFDVSQVYITYTDIGLFRSPDGGKSWIGATEGIPNDWRNTTYWMEFDPEVKGLIWAVFALNHDLPRPKMWRDRSPRRYRGGVAISRDGGRSWTLATEGMDQTAATHILLDPTSPAGRRTLYVCGFGRGVYKSTDDGRTWARKSNGLEGSEPFAWRLTRADDGTLYLVVARRSDDGSIGNGEDGALYRSRDGAESWEKLPLPAGCNGPNGLTLDPTDNRRLYLSAWGRQVFPDDAGGGVFLSEDGGKTWRNTLAASQHVYDVTVDPKNPKVLYACGFDSAAFRSTDGGETWSRLKGYTFKWGHRVVLDPADPSKVYITTFGGSVWHGPAAGDPQAVEDIMTPVKSGTEGR